MNDEDDPHRPMQGLASLPVFFNLKGKRVLLAGGTAGAAWKAELLQAAGAKVDVFSADPGAEMRALAARLAPIALVEREWTDNDFAGAALAVGDFAAEAEASRFAEAARRARVPVNVIDKPKYCDFQFGTIIDRSPLVVAISTAGAAPVFALALRGRLEALLPASLRQWAQAALAWRPKLSDAIDSKNLERRRFWELFVARALSSRAPEDRDFDELIDIARLETTTPAKGGITLISADFADPELLTLKALRLMQAGDIIFYDTRVAPEIVGMARRESTKIHRPAQKDAAARMIAEAQTGKQIVWLVATEADGIDTTLFRMAGIAVEILPGATATKQRKP